MEVKFIPTIQAVREILKPDTYFEYLRNKIFMENEADEDTYDIIYKNWRNTKNNIYTNLSPDSPYKWAAVFEYGFITGLQLIRVDTDQIELIDIEKSAFKYTQYSGIFKPVVEFVKNQYPGKKIITFPLNDTLKEYYKKFGFEDYKQGYIVLK